MSSDGPSASLQEQQPSANPIPRRSRRWILWFLVGFAVVFFSFLLLRTMHTWHPSGRGFIRVKLWRYYLIELERAFADGPFGMRELGPGSGSGTTALIVFLVHAGVSSIGGVMGIGLGLLVRRLRRPSTGGS